MSAERAIRAFAVSAVAEPARSPGRLTESAFAQELVPGRVGAVSGLFFGFAFGPGREILDRIAPGLLWMAASLPDSAWGQEYGVAAPSATELPSRGMSMGAVESRFGAPTRRVAPVGTPPAAVSPSRPEAAALAAAMRSVARG